MRIKRSMPWVEMSIFLMIAGAIGLIMAIVLVKLGYGGRVTGMVSKGSRLALRAMTKRLRRRN
jgi:hypothetical protein